MTIHTTHNSQTRVAESGKFKKQLTLTDLTFIGLGAIFGSDGYSPPATWPPSPVRPGSPRG